MYLGPPCLSDCTTVSDSILLDPKHTVPNLKKNVSLDTAESVKINSYSCSPEKHRITVLEEILSDANSIIFTAAML